MTDLTGPLLAVIAAVGFGLSNIFIRIGMRTDARDNGVGSTIIMNVIIFGLILTASSLWGDLPVMTMWGVAAFVAAGVLTTLLGRIAQYASTRLIGPSRSATFKVASPIFTVAISVGFLNETITAGMFFGAFLVLFGLWMLGGETRRQRLAEQETAAAGDPADLTTDAAGRNTRMAELRKGFILGVLAAASFGTGRVVRKVGLLEIPSPFIGAFIGSVVALSSIMLLDAWQNRQTPSAGTRWRSLVPSISAPFLLAGVATSVGQLSNFGAIFFTQVSTASIIVSTEPLMTILLSWLFLRQEEKITLKILAISGVVFFGVAMIVLYS